MLNPIPWYKSPTFVSATVTIVSSLVVLVPKAGVILGLTSPDSINVAVNALFEMITLIAGAVTAISRGKSTVQPITTTQAAADAQKTPQSQAMQDIHDTQVPK